MKGIACRAALLVTGFLLFQQLAQAQEEVLPPEGVTFRRVSGTNTLTLRNCPLVAGISRVYVTGAGQYLQLPSTIQRGAYELARRYNYFACADPEGDGSYAVYAKIRMYRKTFKYAPALSSFPRSAISRHCAVRRSFPSGLIYKTEGSGHFCPNDCRCHTIGLIATFSSSVNGPGRIEVRDTMGNSVGALGMYAYGGLYRWRAYACIAGTPSRDGGAIASLARANTGSKNVWFDFGTTCYGPVPADVCIGSSQC